MRILFITDNFHPEVNAPAVRTYEHCAQWAKAGASVTIITCVPNFPRGRVFPGYKNKLYQTEEKDGIRIIRVWSYMAPNKGVLRRGLDYASFALSAFIAGLFQKADVVVATSPQFFTTCTGWLLSRLKCRPFVFELRDLWPESIAAVGAVRKGLVLNILEKLELFLYRRAAAVVTVTSGLRANLIRRGIPAGRVHVVSNGVNTDMFSPAPADVDLRRCLGLEDKFVVSFVGTLGMAHGLDFILSSLSQLQDRDVHFLFVGDGAEKGRLQAMAAELELSNCTFPGLIPRSEVPRYLSISDAALVHLKKHEIFKTALPSKIFEAAAMQRPILLGVDGLARDLVQRYRAGIFFEPGNRAAFCLAVQRLQENHQLYEECKKGCCELARDFDRRKMAEEMYHILQKVVRDV